MCFAPVCDLASRSGLSTQTKSGEHEDKQPYTTQQIKDTSHHWWIIYDIGNGAVITEVAQHPRTKHSVPSSLKAHHN